MSCSKNAAPAGGKVSESVQPGKGKGFGCAVSAKHQHFWFRVEYQNFNRSRFKPPQVSS
jgi:hypothetical protein